MNETRALFITVIAVLCFMFKFVYLLMLNYLILSEKDNFSAFRRYIFSKWDQRYVVLCSPCRLSTDHKTLDLRYLVLWSA